MSWKTLENEWGSTTDKGDLVFWSAVLPDIYRLGDISELIIRTIVKNTVASRFVLHKRNEWYQLYEQINRLAVTIMIIQRSQLDRGNKIQVY